MTIANLHRNFKIELDKSSNSGYPAFLPEEIDYWLNSAVMRFIKTRISGLNVHRSGFQSNQKRTDDLKALVTTGTYSDMDYNSELNVYSVSYPDDYMHMLGEQVYLYSTDSCWPKTEDGDPLIVRTDVIEATIENVDSKLSNSLSDHRINRGKAKPIRLQSDNLIYLHTDGNYFIEKYLMTYISMPPKIDAYSIVTGNYSESVNYIPGNIVRFSGKIYKCIEATAGPFNPIKFSIVKDIAKINDTDIDFIMESSIDEVILIAVRLALENISEPRYQTYSQESQLAE